jgi:hypothetical protein
LTWLGLQGEVDQLIWQSRLDSVSTTPGKLVLSQVPSLWTEGELDPLPGTWERSFAGQGICQEEGKENCNNFRVSESVNERPDSSSLKARVCGPVAEKLQGPSGSVLWYCGEPHMA